MNEDVSRAGGKGDLPPLWQSQLIATVKKNMELRTSLLSMLLYIIPFVILTGILIIFTVFSATSDVNFWDPYNGTMGGIVILYFIMSLASLNAMGNEKEVGVRDLMLQVSGSNKNSRRAFILFASSVRSIYCTTNCQHAAA